LSKRLRTNKNFKQYPNKNSQHSISKKTSSFKTKEIKNITNPSNSPKNQHNKKDKKMPLLLKKRNVPYRSNFLSYFRLRPLKKKPSTFEVLNQLELVRKKYPSSNDADSMTNSLVKKRIAAKDIQDLETFNKNEFGKGFYIEGTLERNRSGVCNMFWP
jgi:hypothetical protein